MISFRGSITLLALAAVAGLTVPASAQTAPPETDLRLYDIIDGSSAERIEQLIAIPIETAMREIAEIDEIKSTSKTGSVKITVEIDEEINDLEPVFRARHRERCCR